MNIYEHLDIAAKASGLPMKQLLTMNWWESRHVAERLEGDALVSLHVVRKFAGDHPVNPKMVGIAA